MTPKPIIPRERAQRDIDEAITHYLAEAGANTALGFIDALQRAFRHIAQQPTIGSPRYAYELGLDGLRVWPLRKYPYLVFYMELETQLDVWRVLHAQRDIPAWVQDPQAP